MNASIPSSLRCYLGTSLILKKSLIDLLNGTCFMLGSALLANLISLQLHGILIEVPTIYQFFDAFVG